MFATCARSRLRCDWLPAVRVSAPASAFLPDIVPTTALVAVLRHLRRWTAQHGYTQPDRTPHRTTCKRITWQQHLVHTPVCMCGIHTAAVESSSAPSILDGQHVKVGRAWWAGRVFVVRGSNLSPAQAPSKVQQRQLQIRTPVRTTPRTIATHRRYASCGSCEVALSHLPNGSKLGVIGGRLCPRFGVLGL